jgi:hypothetical protein
MARQAEDKVGCQRDQIRAGRGVRWAGIEVRRAGRRSSRQAEIK